MAMDLEKPVSDMLNMNSENTNYLVSVCCITYNHEQYINGAIEGFLKQETKFPIEIIIHDDASTDKTADIIREYKKKNPGLIFPIIQEENQWSKGIRPSPTYVWPRVRSKYIALCEGDDYWTDPDKLQKQVDFLEANPEYVVCYHNSDVVNEQGVLIKTSKLEPGLMRDASADELKKGFKILTQTMCFRNVIREFPDEYSRGFGGDKFITSLLGSYGKGKYMGNIGNSVFRSHSGGVNRGIIDTAQKRRNFLKTRIALYQYYERIGDAKMRDFYLGEIHRLSSSIINHKRKNCHHLIALRNLLSRLIPYKAR